MLKDIRRIDMEMSLDAVDSEGALVKGVPKESISISALYDARDFSKERIESHIRSNISSIMQGDVSSVDPRILLVDTSQVDRISTFIQNLFREDSSESN